jgi:hypothetical protein
MDKPLREELQLIKHCELFPDRFNDPKQFLKTDVNFEHYVSEFINKYKLTTEITVVFHCSINDLPKAKLNAERVMMLNLYRDFLNPLRHLKDAVFAGDRNRCNEIIDEMYERIIA